MVASQAHRLQLPWKLQAHLDNINYPSDFNQPSWYGKPKPNFLYEMQMHAKSSVSDQQGACNINVSINVSMTAPVVKIQHDLSVLVS